MHAIFVTINIKPGYREQFKEASLGDSQGSVRDEPGCFRFDILEDKTDPNRFYLYEVYEDEEAHMVAHRERAALQEVAGDGAGLVRRRHAGYSDEHGVPVRRRLEGAEAGTAELVAILFR